MEEFQGMSEFQGDFQGDYQSSEEKSRKIKTLIVACVTALVVLIVAVWGIASIIGSVNSKNESEQVAEKTEETQEIKPSFVGDQGEVASPAEQYTPTQEEETVTPVLPSVVAQPQTVAEVPETGPTDLALTALLMGIATMLFLTNYNLKKQNA